MTTSMSFELAYHAPLDKVLAMLFEPAFREAVCDAQHALSRSVVVEGSAESGRVAIDYVQDAAKAPGFVKKLIGDTMSVQQREVWSGNAATVELTLPGKPGEMRGKLRLTEAGGVTTQTVAYDISVHVPLVGGKIERLIEDIIVKGLERENRVGREWLLSR
ncbi:DUF2505 domain-containing protein [Nocardioides sp.]|uniref:DUF2505 domain-containing protein n=1 Tax=Nocardioides sp. TaxID=35761 RepID=UPI0039E3D8C1